MHGTIVEQGSDDHSGRSYKIQTTKVGFTITRTLSHVKDTPITAENYLRNKISKSNIPQATGKFGTLVNHFTKLCKHEQSREDETNRSVMVKGAPMSKPHLWQLLRNADQSGNSSVWQNDSKKDTHTHTHTHTEQINTTQEIVTTTRSGGTIRNP